MQKRWWWRHRGSVSRKGTQGTLINPHNFGPAQDTDLGVVSSDSPGSSLLWDTLHAETLRWRHRGSVSRKGTQGTLINPHNFGPAQDTDLGVVSSDSPGSSLLRDTLHAETPGDDVIDSIFTIFDLCSYYISWKDSIKGRKYFRSVLYCIICGLTCMPPKKGYVQL